MALKSLGMPAHGGSLAASCAITFRSCLQKSGEARGSGGSPLNTSSPVGSTRDTVRCREIANEEEGARELASMVSGRVRAFHVGDVAISQATSPTADPRFAMAQHAQAVLTQLRTGIDGRSVRMQLSLGTDRDVVVTVRADEDGVVIAVGGSPSNGDIAKAFVRSLTRRGRSITVELDESAAG